MDIDEIKKSVLLIEDKTSLKMRRAIHYNSIRNFTIHFDEIKSNGSRKEILNLLKSYLEVIEAQNYDVESDSSIDLARKYVFPIGDYFKDESNFVKTFHLRNVIVYGIMIDSLLLISGLLKKISYIPIFTLGFLFYEFFVMIFKEPKNRVYGLYY